MKKSTPPDSEDLTHAAHERWVAQRQLYRLAQEGDPSSIPECVARGALPDWSNSAALREAARRGRLDAVDILLSFAPCKKDASLAMLEAVACGRAKVVDRLLPLSERCVYKKAFLVAIECREVECLARIARFMGSKAGKSVDSEPFLMCARQGWLPGILALEGVFNSRTHRQDATRAAIKQGNRELAMYLAASMELPDLRSMQEYAKHGKREEMSSWLAGVIQARIDSAAIEAELAQEEWRSSIEMVVKPGGKGPRCKSI